MIEKSEFMISLATPMAWLQGKSNVISSSKEESNDEWQRKLDKWRETQQSKGIIKSMEAINNNNKALDSIAANIFSLLQSAVHTKKMRK